MGSTRMTIRDHQLDRRDRQHAEIDYKVFPYSALRFCCAHIQESFSCLLLVFRLVCHAHEIDQGHDEHPNDVDELPKESAVFDMRRAVTAALVAKADDKHGN